MNKYKNYLLGFLTFSVGFVIGMTVHSFLTSQKNSNPYINAYKKDHLSGNNDLIFKLNNRSYRYKDLPNELKYYFYSIENERYERMIQTINIFAVRIELLKRMGRIVDVHNLPLLKDFFFKVPQSDIEKHYQKNKGRYPSSLTKTKIFKLIHEELLKKDIAEKYKTAMAFIQSESRLKYHISPPELPETELNFDNYPTIGNPSAKYHLVGIANYNCVDCQKYNEELKRLFSKYQKNFKYTHINFTRDLTGPEAPFIKASQCALEQNESFFWKYHLNALSDKSILLLQENDLNLSEKKAKQLAKNLKINQDHFEACYNNYQEILHTKLDRTQRLIDRLHIKKIPTFFFNRKKLPLVHSSLTKSIQNYIAE